MNNFDVIIIGAGAAGLMCAIEAGKRGRKVLLVDHAKAVGEKIRISGGGRCNFTNLHATPKNFISQNPHFCVSALSRYTQHDFIKLVEKHGIKYHEKTLGQLFCDDSSRQIINMLLDECAQAGVEILLNTSITTIAKTETNFQLQTSNFQLTSTSLVIATGGPSIPKMGATGFAYDIAKQFGINVITPRAGLVPFTLEVPQELSGVSLEVIASCNGVSFREGMLFTHRGLSGPAILQISSYWNDGDEVRINLLPDADAFELLKQKRAEFSKQEFHNVLGYILPKRLAQFIADISGLSGQVANLSDAKLKAVDELIHNWRIVPSGTEGYRTAEVALGGVDTNELSGKTFEAKKVSGLYFIGECVDVTGWLGGFNFQWAWSSGHACGQVV